QRTSHLRQHQVCKRDGHAEQHVGELYHQQGQPLLPAEAEDASLAHPAAHAIAHLGLPYASFGQVDGDVHLEVGCCWATRKVSAADMCADSAAQAAAACWQAPCRSLPKKAAFDCRFSMSSLVFIVEPGLQTSIRKHGPAVGAGVVPGSNKDARRVP